MPWLKLTLPSLRFSVLLSSIAGAMLIGILTLYVKRTRVKTRRKGLKQRENPRQHMAAITPYRHSNDESLVGSTTSQVAGDDVDASQAVALNDQTSNLSFYTKGVETLCKAVELFDKALETDEMPDADPELRNLLVQLIEEGKEVSSRHVSMLSGASLNTSLQTNDLSVGQNFNFQEQLHVSSSDSDNDSYMSATETSDFEVVNPPSVKLNLLSQGMLQVKDSAVKCRKYRTEMLGLPDDEAFLAQLFGVRLALQIAFTEKSTVCSFRASIRRLTIKLLCAAERDWKEADEALLRMFNFIDDPSNWSDIETELTERGVVNFGVFDIFFDFIILDALDDLKSPPQAVTAVLNNRWLSTGFKETALGVAISSIIRAKRALLRQPHGYLGHIYDISTHITPILTCGLLLDNSPVASLCHKIMNELVSLSREMFLFNSCTNACHLSHVLVDCLKCHLSKVEHLIDENLADGLAIGSI